MPIKAIRGDITKIHATVIVNAANTRMVPGGGVDGAINKAAGPELAKAMAKTKGCKTGFAKLTPAYNLPAEWVVHTVGPIYDKYDPLEAKSLLHSCYLNSMVLVKELKAKSVSFPLISTGVYGFPLQSATRIAVKTIQDFLKEKGSNITVNLVAFDQQAFDAINEALEWYKRPSQRD